MFSLLNKALRSLRQSFEQGRAIRQLYAMSDRELQDIGIARAEIEAIVTGAIVRPTADPALVRPSARIANSRRAPATHTALDAA